MHAPHTPPDDPSTAKQLAPSHVLAVAWRDRRRLHECDVCRAKDRISARYRPSVVAKPVLDGLHYEYRLEPMAA